MQTALPSPALRARRLPLLSTLLCALAVHGCGGGGDVGPCGGPFCVRPPEAQEATRLLPSSGDGQTGAPGRELAQPVEVLVTDEANHPVAGVKVSFTVSQGGGSLSAAAVESDHEGKVPVRWTLGPEAGTQMIQAAATDSSGTHLSGSPLTLTAQAVISSAASIAFRQAPSDTVRNGVVFERQPVVELLDADNQPVAGVEVTASIASGGGSLSGITSVATDSSGRASYSDLALLGLTGPRILRFSVAGPALEVATEAIQVAAGAPSQLAGLEPLVYQATVNSPVIPSPSVIVRDAAGNAVPGVPIVFTADRDASVSPAAAVVTNDAGVAQISSWTLGKTAELQYRLTARIESTAIEPVAFSATAHAGAAGRLEITVQPPPATQSGVVFAPQPELRVLDQLGNPAHQAGLTIVATIASGPSGALQHASATTDASGQAAFSGLSLTGLAGSYTLSFSAAGLGGVTSQSISLAAGSPSGIALVVAPPSTARSRVPFSAQPSVQLQDASGNPLAQAGIEIRASIASGGGSLTGLTAVVTNGNGRADFTDLAIMGPPGPRTLRFASQSPSSQVLSGQITLPSVAGISIVPSPPSSGVAGSQLANPVSWILTDALEQTVADAPGGLSASAGGIVAPSSTTSDASGVVQLQSWTLSQLAGPQYVDLVVGGETSRVPIEAVPDVAAQLQKISGDSQSAPVDSELPEPLVIRVVDQYGNGVSGVTVEWRTCDGLGSYDAATDAGGYASAFQPTGPDAGTFCAMASSSGLAGSPVQFTYTVLAAGGGVTPESRTGRVPALAPAERRR
ncbi:MAG: Ig-like domain-containing protein [Gemmatimonadales bacterium]